MATGGRLACNTAGVLGALVGERFVPSGARPSPPTGPRIQWCQWIAEPIVTSGLVGVGAGALSIIVAIGVGLPFAAWRLGYQLNA
jgi:hypothetical protein